ncbi:MAG: LysR family transcriptional regulator [Pseudomonadota bacterium]|nr:LysR family transcriptional regulator [Pseudomonadota bacterium]
MARESFNDLLAFLAVAQERSFTRAAARLGVSQSALSHTIRSFEARLRVRLLTRNTRGVVPTAAGERLLQSAAPRFDEIRAELAAIGDLVDKPSGKLRISATDYTIRTVLWPKLRPFLRDYPDIHIEFFSEYALIDIVAERFDLGVRLGDSLAKDMVAVRITADEPMAIVAAPAYLAGRVAPQQPADLSAHPCINLRTRAHGAIYAWELEKDGRKLQARVEGQLCFNGVYEILAAALDGFGLAYLPADLVRPQLASGELVSLLPDWCPTFPGWHAYFPSRRQSLRALTLVVDVLRHRAEN